MKNILGASWRSTSIGILTLIGAIAMAVVSLLDNDPSTTINTEVILSALVGIGFLSTRDDKVSSEKAGAR